MEGHNSSKLTFSMVVLLSKKKLTIEWWQHVLVRWGIQTFVSIQFCRIWSYNACSDWLSSQCYMTMMRLKDEYDVTYQIWWPLFYNRNRKWCTSLHNLMQTRQWGWENVNPSCRHGFTEKHVTTHAINSISLLSLVFVSLDFHTCALMS